MDILLTHGFFLAEDTAEQRVMKPYPPLGLLYISSYLKGKGFDVRLCDNTFSTREAFFHLLENERPGIVGIYVNMVTKFNALAIIRRAKALGAQVVVGGPDPPYYAEEYLHHGADVVVLGEGEETLEELVPLLKETPGSEPKQVAGIVYRNEGGQVQRTAARPFIPDLDTMPLPDRSSIELNRYIEAWRRHHGYGPISLITARGCPYQCTWCSHSVFGKSLRKRSPESVADEVELLINTYAPDALWFADDVFNIDHKWLFSYAEILKQRKISIPFECICRADRLNEELVETLKEMGCEKIWLGSESGSQRLLDAMKRGVKAEQVQKMTRVSRNHGIRTGMFLMWGFEDECHDDIRETIDHVKKALPDEVLTTVSYPIKGTEYYDRMESAGRIAGNGAWETANDRMLRIRRRHSKRYYDHVNRWLHNEVARARISTTASSFWTRLRVYAAIQAGKLGMLLTSFQREV